MTAFRRPRDGVAAGDAMPFYWNGEYHVFHLTCPPDTLGQQYPTRVRTSWRHIRSTDLRTWEELPVAIPPGEGGPDAHGSWTGSVILKDGVFYGFYTGHRVGAEYPQTICLATSTDLVNFEKDPRNPLIVPDTTTYENVDWRDPYVFWNEDEGRYWMLIAARLNSGPIGRRGCVVLTTSADLLEWGPPEPFYTPYSTFCPECPELFRLGEWWYLVYSRFSEFAQTIYRIGDSARGPWRTPLHDGIDGRRVYAAKSTSDGQRRFMFGTVYERVGLSNDSDWTYGGDMSTARELTALRDGELAVSCPPEILEEYGRRAPFTIGERRGDWKADADGAEVESLGGLAYAYFDAPGSEYLLDCTITPRDLHDYFGLILKGTPGLESIFALIFEPGAARAVITRFPQPLDPFWAALTERAVPRPEVDGPRLVERPVELAPGQPIRCRVLVSGSIVEAFVNDRVCLTYRIYDDEEFRPGLLVQDGSVAFRPLELRKPG